MILSAGPDRWCRTVFLGRPSMQTAEVFGSSRVPFVDAVESRASWCSDMQANRLAGWRLTLVTARSTLVLSATESFDGTEPHAAHRRTSQVRAREPPVGTAREYLVPRTSCGVMLPAGARPRGRRRRIQPVCDAVFT